jgi:hypothetical protein
VGACGIDSVKPIPEGLRWPYYDRGSIDRVHSNENEITLCRPIIVIQHPAQALTTLDGALAHLAGFRKY